jgi:hypothetical protein
MKKAYRSVAILLSLAWMGCGNAAAAASYVVLSLVDHQLSVGTVDGRSNAPQWASYPRTDGAFDLVALQATDAAIHKVEPDASVILLRTTDPRIYALQKKWTEGERIDVAVLAALLKPQLAEAPDARLVLIAEHRAIVKLPGLTEFGGAVRGATASGLGFYVETNLKIVDESSREVGSGYIAPFTNFRMVLIDPRAMTIEANLPTAAAKVITDQRPANQGDTWNAISDRDRIRHLASLLAGEVARMTPLLLQDKRR